MANSTNSPKADSWLNLSQVKLTPEKRAQIMEIVASCETTPLYELKSAVYKNRSNMQGLHELANTGLQSLFIGTVRANTGAKQVVQATDAGYTAEEIAAAKAANGVAPEAKTDASDDDMPF